MRSPATTSDLGLRHGRQIWLSGYAVIVGGGLVIAAIARRRVAEPFLGLSLAVILLLLLGWLILPRATLYATLFLTAVSDQVTVWWFPFAKNLSSRESISYVADSLTISPLDISLGLGLVISCVRRYAATGTIVARTPLFRPLLVFELFVAYGFVRGISSGGNLRVAVLEGRPVFYILMVFVIAVNECSENEHLRAAVLALLGGVVVQSLLSIEHLSGLDPAARDDLESLTEHGSSLGQNLLIVTYLSLLLFGIRARILRFALVVGLVPTVYVFLVAQRRAGVAALVIAGAAMAIALFWRRRRTFWAVTPIVLLVITGYVGAFWNSTSSAAFPAQAIKTIISPESASAEDRSSDLYRIIEAYDLNFTIRANPIFGIGFGQPFYRPVALPDISVFELNAYQPHNSLLWVWIKTGFGGFAAMFYVFGKALLLAADRIRRIRFGVDLAISVSAAMFIIMYVVYTYVDVSWDARNTVFLGLALAIVGGSVAPALDPDEVPGDERAEAADRVDGAPPDEPAPAGGSVRRVDDPLVTSAY